MRCFVLRKFCIMSPYGGWGCTARQPSHFEELPFQSPYGDGGCTGDKCPLDVLAEYQSPCGVWL